MKNNITQQASFPDTVSFCLKMGMKKMFFGYYLLKICQRSASHPLSKASEQNLQFKILLNLEVCMYL